jgi:RNA polymerase sigma factor (sigma-70 family)
MVYGICRLLLRDPGEAEDATQESFLAAYRSMLSGHQPREPAKWLATIARNECRDRGRSRPADRMELRDDDEGHAEGAYEAVIRRDDLAQLRLELEALPTRQREAVILRDLHGLRYDEVGAALGVSKPTVEALLFRGRRRLRARLIAVRPAAGALVLPISIQDGLSMSLPGFNNGVTATAVGGGGGAGLAVVAKILSAPAAAKLAAAGTLAVTVAGTLGVVANQDTPPNRATRQSATAAAQPAHAGASASPARLASELASGPAGPDARSEAERETGSRLTLSPTESASLERETTHDSDDNTHMGAKSGASEVGESRDDNGGTAPVLPTTNTVTIGTGAPATQPARTQRTDTPGVSNGETEDRGNREPGRLGSQSDNPLAGAGGD